MEKEEKIKRQEYVIRIGPILKKILDKQIQKVKDATYGCVPSSYWEAGEILGKKVNNGNIL
jgi:hypothetical protein